MYAYFHEYSNSDFPALKQRVVHIVLVDRFQCARSVCIVSSSHWHHIAIASQVLSCQRAALLNFPIRIRCYQLKCLHKYTAVLLCIMILGLYLRSFQF